MDSLYFTAEVTAGTASVACSDTPYSVHPLFRKGTTAAPSLETSQPMVPVKDRVVNSEAMVLGFMAEHNLAFSLVPDLIDLAKALAADKRALDELSIDRTSASYKMKYGLGKTMNDNLVKDLRCFFFSLNIDEATSKNLHRVLSVLVSYFSPLLKQVVVHHLDSISVVHVNSDTIYNAILEMFSKKGIPWSNFMSLLSDSCNVMRGSKNGVEVRLRTHKAPHLLDIDGDSCHHAHNASKRISEKFDKFVEAMFWAAYADFQYSADLVDMLREICCLLNVSYTMPERYVPTRWLSVLEVSTDTLRLFDAYTIMYFGFVTTQAERTDYLRHCVEVYHRLHLSEDARTRIREIQAKLKDKKMTKEGKERKQKVIQRLFVERKKTLLILHFYTSTFPLLKKYVQMFQNKEPMLHKLNDMQLQLLSDFLSCFIKIDFISGANAKKLVSLDLKETKYWVEDKDLYLGSAKKILESCHKTNPLVVSFTNSVKEAYLSCGLYLQKKMPLQNKLLQCLSALDPVVRGKTTALQHMTVLPKLVTNVLSEVDLVGYDMEVRRFHVDISLPGPEASINARLDTWWADIFTRGDYPALSKLVGALLSCFTAPLVEGSFSMMGNIMSSSKARMNIGTFCSIQSVKFSLMAAEQSAINHFKKDKFLHEPVDKSLLRNMRSAHKEYKDEQRQIKEEKEKKKEQLKLSTEKVVSKQQAKAVAELASKRSRLAHQRARLDQLVKKKRAAADQQRQSIIEQRQTNRSGKQIMPHKAACPQGKGQMAHKKTCPIEKTKETTSRQAKELRKTTQGLKNRHSNKASHKRHFTESMSTVCKRAKTMPMPMNPVAQYV